MRDPILRPGLATGTPSGADVVLGLGSVQVTGVVLRAGLITGTPAGADVVLLRAVLNALLIPAIPVGAGAFLKTVRQDLSYRLRLRR